MQTEKHCLECLPQPSVLSNSIFSGDTGNVYIFLWKKPFSTLQELSLATLID